MATGGHFDLSKIPVKPPPPGVVPNFIDPPSRSRTVIIVISGMLAITTCFSILRCYTRWYLGRTFGSSDYLFLLGFILVVTNSSLVLDSTRYGFGRRQWNVPLSFLFPHLLKNLWWQTKTYALSLGCSKISILFLYPQLSPSRLFRIWIWILVALVACFALSAFLWEVFLCNPIQAYWDFKLAQTHTCHPHDIFIAYTGTCNILTDIAMLTLPVLILWHAVLPGRKKVAVGLLLASGSFASLISIIRMAVSIKLMPVHDPTYAVVDIVLLSVAEMDAAVICACLPTLKPFARRFCPFLLWSSTDGSDRRPLGMAELDERGRIVQHQMHTVDIALHTRRGDDVKSGAQKSRDKSRDNLSERGFLSNRNAVEWTNQDAHEQDEDENDIIGRAV